MHGSTSQPSAHRVLEIEGLRFGWPGKPALIDIAQFAVDGGERVFLHGPSGTGKSTLLNLVAGTLAPQAGSIRLAGEAITGRSERHRDRLRADHIGFVFQMFNLLPYLSVLDNVMLPCRFSARRRERAIARDGSLQHAARRLLSSLGLAAEDLQSRAAAGLSVGQQQRVAAARALIGAPELVMADEPTSALDHDAREGFLRLLFDECAHAGSALVFVSHDHTLEPLFERRLDLRELNRAAPAGVDHGA
jgi:putative ABC transport system ATP-binding protein